MVLFLVILAAVAAGPEPSEAEGWVPVCRPEDLPKGELERFRQDACLDHHQRGVALPASCPCVCATCLLMSYPVSYHAAGVRKELEVDGRTVLLFWYRNQIYCIESRSPAEGAYSEGFIKAKFTQVCMGATCSSNKHHFWGRLQLGCTAAVMCA